MSARFNETEKRKFIEQLDKKSALQLAKEYGGKPSQTTILRWKRELEPLPKGSMPRGERPVEKFTKTDRLDFVLKTMFLPQNEIKRIADEKGITLETLDSWRLEYMFTLAQPLSTPNTTVLAEENEMLKNRLHQLESILQQALVPLKDIHP
jgi:hypothetical protein